MKGTKLFAAVAGFTGLAVSGAAYAIAWYFQSPASKLAADIDMLHQYVMWLIIVIFVGVFGIMFWACYAHRRSKGDAASRFHENATVEILWTLIPAIILVAIAWPVIKGVIAQKDASSPDRAVKVVSQEDNSK
jgi:cytochrome c oxidase subunit 2